MTVTQDLTFTGSLESIDRHPTHLKEGPQVSYDIRHTLLGSWLHTVIRLCSQTVSFIVDVCYLYHSRYRYDRMHFEWRFGASPFCVTWAIMSISRLMGHSYPKLYVRISSVFYNPTLYFDISAHRPSCPDMHSHHHDHLHPDD